MNPDWLAGQPAVPRVSRGMIYLARGAAEEAELDALLRHAAENEMTDVRRIGVAELKELEPALNTEGVTAALFSNTESIVDPWLLGTVSLNKFCSTARCRWLISLLGLLIHVPLMAAQFCALRLEWSSL